MRLIISFGMYGAVAGFVAYHFWQSRRRRELIWGIKVWGAAGAVVGIPVGIAIYELVVMHSLRGASESETAVVTLIVIRCFSLAATTAALIEGTRRNLFKKAIFLPIVITLVPSCVALTFIDLDQSYVARQDPRHVLAMLETGAGQAVALPLAVASWLRFRPRRSERLQGKRHRS